MTGNVSHIANLIDREWINEDQLSEIFARVEIDPAPDVQADQVKIILNEIINFSINNQISSLLPRNYWKEMQTKTTRFLEYAEEVENLRRNGFPMYEIPNDLRRDAENLLDQITMWLATKNKKSLHAWESVFYPRCLALYNVTYDRKPVSTVSEYSDSNMGSTANFIHAIISHVRDKQREIEFDKRFAETSKKSINWIIPSESSLKNKLSHWKKQRPKDRNGETIWRAQPMWQRHVQPYKMRVIR